MPFPYTLPYTNWNQPDIGGLAQCIAYIMTGGGDITGLATEATLLDVLATLNTGAPSESVAEILVDIRTDLESSSDGTRVADLLEEIIIQNAAIESNTDTIATNSSSGAAYANRTNWVSGDSGAIITDAATDVIAAPGASTFIYITSVLVTNSHASVGTLVSLRDEDGAAIPGATGYAAPAGGGYALTGLNIKMPTANKKLQAICGTTGANVYVSITGYKGA